MNMPTLHFVLILIMVDGCKLDDLILMSRES